jgi:hypothetical protein
MLIMVLRRRLFLATSSAVTPTKNCSSPECSRWETKLFTNEDPRGIHKILGVYVLLHFPIALLMYFATLLAWEIAEAKDLASLRRSVSPARTLCLSLIFRTVPRERIVGNHDLARIPRSQRCFRCVPWCQPLAWLSIYKHPRSSLA